MIYRAVAVTCVVLAAWGAHSLAAEGEAFTDPIQAGPDYAIQGEYLGEVATDEGSKTLGAQIVALGEGRFHAVVFHGGLPGQGWEGKFKLQTSFVRQPAPDAPPDAARINDIYPSYGPAPDDWVAGQETHQGDGKLIDGAAVFEGAEGKATIRDGVMTLTDSGGNQIGQLQRVERKSPTLGAAPPEGAVVLFDGTSADGWDGGRMTEDGLLIAGCKSKRNFRDFTIHLELRTPFMPAAREQGRGNSGMYLQDRYEVQVLDSFGLEGRNNECSGLYSLAAPRINAALPPLAWQTYDADFTAARFDDAKNKTSNARVTLRFNGIVVYDDFEIPALTPGGAPEEFPGEGPIQLQDHGNPVHYRNIWVVER
jgi:hypothetical protein